MTTVEQNKEIIRRWVEARNCNDLQAALDVWAEDWQERLAKNFSAFTQVFPDVHITIEELFGEGDQVVLYATMHGTHQGTYMNVDATGRKVAIPNMDIYTVRDGKIQTIIRITDGIEALKQIGVSVSWMGKSIF